MYTEYNSSNIYDTNQVNYDYDNNNDNNKNSSNKIFSIIWKILLVLIVFIVLFLVLFQFKIISFKSSIAPTAILLNQNEIGIKKGSTYQLVSTVLPENANNKQVVWTSSDTSIVEVNEASGYIKGKKVGKAVITVKTLINDLVSECLVTVTDNNVLVTNVSFNQKRISVAVGYTHNLTYTVTPKNATELGLKFVSSDPSVATVSAKGVVKGVKVGSATITVMTNNGEVKDTTYVSVYKKGVSTVVNGESVKTESYPKSITLNDENLNLKVGGTSQLIATIKPDEANKNVSFTSSNTNVAVVDTNGVVTAKGIGTATIVAKTVNNLIATCQVVVGNYSLKLKSILITTDYSVIPVGREKQLVVAFNPSNASDKSVTWSSNNQGVATVDASGKVKTLKEGSAVITAKSRDGGYTSTTIIEVISREEVVEETSISFTDSNYSVGINSSITLNPIITPQNATFRSVSFESSDESIATVDQNGVVTGKKSGEVVITVTTKRKNLKAKVTVKVKEIEATGVTLSNTNITLKTGETYTLNATIKPANASNKNLTFKSDNTNIAEVDTNGIIKAKSKGTTTIKVIPSGGGSSSTCIVEVK